MRWREGAFVVPLKHEVRIDLCQPHAQRCVIRGREMDGWLRVDPAGVKMLRDLTRWVAIGVGYARQLLPK